MSIGGVAIVPLSEPGRISLFAAIAAAGSAVAAIVMLIVTVWRDIIRDKPKLLADINFSPDANGGLLMNLSAVNTGRRPISVIGWIVISRNAKSVVPLSGFFLKEAETWSCGTPAGVGFGPKDLVDVFCRDTAGKEWHVPKRTLRKLEANLLLFTNFLSGQSN